MVKIKRVTVKGYEFTGYINVDDLTPAQLDALRIVSPETHDSDEIEVIGSFSVDAYQDDVSSVSDMEYVTMLGAKTGKMIQEQDGWIRTKDPVTGITVATPKYKDVPERVMVDMHPDDYDCDQLCEDIIAQDDGSWYQDKIEGMADAAYDAWKESQYD